MVLHLLDPVGTELNNGDRYAFHRITMDGKYIVVVRGRSANDVGDYLLTVTNTRREYLLDVTITRD